MDKFKAEIFKHFDKNGNPIADEAFLERLLKLKEKGKSPGFIFKIKNDWEKLHQAAFLGQERKLLETLNFDSLPMELKELVDHRLLYGHVAMTEAIPGRVGALLLIPVIALVGVIGLIALIGYFISLAFS